MKKIILIIIFLLNTSILNANTNLAYLDVQFIIDNSNLGIFYKKKLIELQKSSKKEIDLKEKKLKELETQINNQKNILKKEEIDKKIANLNILLKDYQNTRKQINQNLINEKKAYTTKVLNILNPLLTQYVEKNNIQLLIEKKNILVGVKNLDITNNILNILNEETNNKKLINEN